MITISYTKADVELDRVLEKLKELSLAHKIVVRPTLDQVQLEDGSTKVQGETAIQTYLQELEAELDQWHYCSC